MASWSVAVRRPSDLGYDDASFVLPDLVMHQTTVQVEETSGALFPLEAITLAERRTARRDSLSERVEAVAELANASNEPWIIWCDLKS